MLPLNSQSDSRHDLRAVAHNSWLYTHERDEAYDLAEHGTDEECALKAADLWRHIGHRRAAYEMSR